MNIFLLDTDHVTRAALHFDCHVSKMALEALQMLCTAHGSGAPYRPTHRNHPWTVWVRSCLAAYRWTVAHAAALLDEYAHRWGRRSVKMDAVLAWCREKEPALPEVETPAWPLCTGGIVGETVQAYRRYYLGKRSLRRATYTRRAVPAWVEA